MTHAELIARLGLTMGGAWRIEDRGSKPAAVCDLVELAPWAYRGEVILWAYEEDGELDFAGYVKAVVRVVTAGGDQAAILHVAPLSSARTPEGAIERALYQAAADAYIKAKKVKRASAEQLRELAKAGGIRT